MMLGVILAGGEGSRLGGNKPNALLGDNALISWTIQALAPQVSTLALAGNAPGLEQYALPILPDVPGMAGPAAGLYAALHAAKAHQVRALLVVPCDMPFLPHDLGHRLSGGRVCVPSIAGRAIWSISYWPAAGIDAAYANAPKMSSIDRGVSLRSVMQSAECHIMPQSDPDAFFGVNTPEALEIAQARLKASQ